MITILEKFCTELVMGGGGGGGKSDYKVCFRSQKRTNVLSTFNDVVTHIDERTINRLQTNNKQMSVLDSIHHYVRLYHNRFLIMGSTHFCQKLLC